MAKDDVKATEEMTEMNKVKMLKHNLEGWKDVLLPINSVLTWERNCDPGILFGLTSTIFFLIWYFEPSVLTTVSLLGIIICVIDYLVPTLSANLFDPDKWTMSKERKFEDICKGIVKTWGYYQSFHSSMKYLKDTKPKLYFIVVLLILILFAWIGNQLDNLLLTYIFVTLLVLLPGLKRHGLLQIFCHRFIIIIRRPCSSSKEKKN